MEVVSITILTIFTIFIIFKLRIRYWCKNKLPSGPWNLPIIGSIHHFVANSSSGPHIALQKLSKAYGPLMHVKVGQLKIIVASSSETAKALMKTHDLAFSTRPLLEAGKILTYNGKDIFFAPYGEYWRQVRKICVLELLSAKRVSSFSPLRHQEIRDLLCSLLSSSSSSSSSYGTIINVSERVKMCINNITVGASVGGKWLKDDQMNFFNAMNEALDVATVGLNLHDLFPSFSWLLGFFSSSKAKVEESHRRLDAVAERILQKHKLKEATSKEEIEDFVDILLKLRRDDTLQFQLTDDCIKAIVMDMVGAGSETSSTVILWAMSELMRNPAAMEKAQKEIREKFREEPAITEARVGEAKYLQLVIKETLRLHPHLLVRECRETSNVLGYEIPQGTIAMVNVWAIGRDPNYWEDPEEFKPERFEGSAYDFKGNNFEFLPFGAGRRMCPGLLFGTANVELVLANLLYHFDWKLPEGVRRDELDMTVKLGASMSRKSDLCLRLKVAIPLPE